MNRSLLLLLRLWESRPSCRGEPQFSSPDCSDIYFGWHWSLVPKTQIWPGVELARSGVQGMLLL